MKGLLAAPPRSPNGYREYPAEALGRVRLVRRAVALGFTLDELAASWRCATAAARPAATCARSRSRSSRRSSPAWTRSPPRVT